MENQIKTPITRVFGQNWPEVYSDLDVITKALAAEARWVPEASVLIPEDGFYRLICFVKGPTRQLKVMEVKFFLNYQHKVILIQVL